MARRIAPREVDPETGAIQLALYDETKARLTISNAHRMALRTAEALRKLVLFAPEGCVIGKSEIADFPPGKVDPIVMLVLKARDSYLTEEKDFARLGFFKEMRALYQDAQARTAELVKSMTAAIERQRDREQTDRHHREKLEFLKGKTEKDKSGMTLRSLMDRAMDGVVANKIEEQLDRLVPIVVEDVPEDAGDDPGGIVTDLPDDITPEMAQRLADEYRKSLAVAHYKPSPTQTRFHESMAHDRLLTAGGRGGKTTAALWDLATVAMGCNPHKPWYGPVVIIVLCISRQNAHAVVQRKLLEACELPGPIGNQPFIPEDEIDHSESASIKAPFRTFYHIKLKNGSMIHFGWSGDQNSWKKLQGIKADYVYIDENAGNDKLVIELMKRLLDVQSDPTKQPWGGCMVWGATGTIVNQTFELFRKRCLAGDADSAAFVIPPGETGAISAAVHARFAKKLTKEERKIHIDGTETASSMTYIFGKQWDDRRHVLPVDAVIEDSDNIIIGYDPGVEHPTGILICLLKKNRPSQLVCAKFFNHRLMPVEFDVECIHSFLKGRKIALFVYDHRAKERHKHAAPLIHAVSSRMEAKGYVPMQGYAISDKRHEVGIATVRSGLDPNHYDKTVEPMIVVSPSDESGGMLMRGQIMSYRGKEETNFTGPGGVVKKDDEFCDCLRYVYRMMPTWSSALMCGPATYSAAHPMDVPPIQVGPPPVLMTPEQIRVEKSKLIASRTRESVAREFSFIRRNRPALVEVN